MEREYGDYLVYVDESGDHSLKKVNLPYIYADENCILKETDSSYPIFSLAFCIFRKDDYLKHVIATLNAIKFKYWGHPDIVLHERDIRKNRSGNWSILNNKKTKENFMADIADLVESIPFTVIAAVINKLSLKTFYKAPNNPYELAMLFCMERLTAFLCENAQRERRIHILCEARGNNEDKKLEMEFRRICDNAPPPRPGLTSHTDFSQIDYRIQFLSKKSNSSGLQIADLIARPIGLHVLRPGQTNRAFSSIEKKLFKHENGSYAGRGLKVFPP